MHDSPHQTSTLIGKHQQSHNQDCSADPFFVIARHFSFCFSGFAKVLIACGMRVKTSDISHNKAPTLVFAVVYSECYNHAMTILKFFELLTVQTQQERDQH